MKIIINRNTLAQALAEVSPFINSKIAIPALKGIKITTKGNRVKFEASDAQASIRNYVEAVEIDQDGELIVDADLGKYIQKVSGDNITLEIDENNLSVKHSHGKAEYSVMPADQYPAMDMPTENVVEIRLPASILSDCINTAKGFVGSDDLRPQMKSIYAYIKEGEFGYCATDTRMMMTDHTPVSLPSDTDVHWFIEPSVFSAVIKGCKGIDEAVIKIAPTAVSYKLGKTIIQTVQTKGKFPDFKRVIPKEWSMECHIDRKDLIDSIGRVSMFANESRLIKLAFTPMDVALSSDNVNTLKRSSETLQHNGCGGEITLGLHADYLLTCLGACDANEVALRMTDASRPVLIFHENKPTATCLLMPMALQQ